MLPELVIVCRIQCKLMVVALGLAALYSFLLADVSLSILW